MSSCPSIICWTIICPLNGPDTLTDNQLTTDVWIHFWTLSSKVSMSIFLPVPYCPDYPCFVVHFEVKKGESSYFILFQDCFGYSESFAIPYGFQSQLVNLYKITWDTGRDHAESVDPLGEICANLTMVSFQSMIMGCFPISFNNVL